MTLIDRILKYSRLYSKSSNKKIIYPNDGALLLSDYFSISERSQNRLRFVRPINDKNSFQHCSPGTKVSFRTDSRFIRFNTCSNSLVTRKDARNFTLCVTVNGQPYKAFKSRGGVNRPAFSSHNVIFNDNSTRNISLVWPYADGLDLNSIEIDADAELFGAPTAHNNKALICGDSIPQGFRASDTLRTWSYKLCDHEKLQMINLGYGSRVATAGDGNLIHGMSDVSLIVYHVGYNNFAAQTPIDDFRDAVSGFLTNARSGYQDAEIYAITPLYSPAINKINLDRYRSAIVEAVAFLSDPNILVIDGLTLMVNDRSRLTDGVHPNDLGSTEIAAGIAAVRAKRKSRGLTP